MAAVSRHAAAGVLLLAPPNVRNLNESTCLSIVIPCLDEEAVLPLLRERIRTAARHWGVTYEVILVDDGSTDGTWDAVCRFHQQDRRWKGIRLSRNFGHQAALWAGLCQARGDVIALLDADLQDPPEVLSALLERWATGDDVVYAIRKKRKEAWPKRLAYHLFYRLLAKLADAQIPLDSGDFCVMDRRVVRAMLASPEQTPFLRGLRAWVGFRQSSYAYERERRAGGRVKFTFRRLMRLALDGLISSSTQPLRLAFWLGLLFSVISLPVAVSFSGVVAAMLLLGGVQLVVLGILGEYIGRIFHGVQGRPRAIIADRCSSRPHRRPPRDAAKTTLNP